MTKIIKCIKCKQNFKTELDKHGIPYNKTCKCCHKHNQKLKINTKIYASWDKSINCM